MGRGSLVKLELMWHVVNDDEVNDIFNKEKFSPYDFNIGHGDSTGYHDCKIEVTDEELDRLDKYWQNPFVWSPLEE